MCTLLNRMLQTEAGKMRKSQDTVTEFICETYDHFYDSVSFKVYIQAKHNKNGYKLLQTSGNVHMSLCQFTARPHHGHGVHHNRTQYTMWPLPS